MGVATAFMNPAFIVHFDVHGGVAVVIAMIDDGC